MTKRHRRIARRNPNRVNQWEANSIYWMSLAFACMIALRLIAGAWGWNE